MLARAGVCVCECARALVCVCEQASGPDHTFGCVRVPFVWHRLGARLVDCHDTAARTRTHTTRRHTLLTARRRGPCLSARYIVPSRRIVGERYFERPAWKLRHRVSEIR